MTMNLKLLEMEDHHIDYIEVIKMAEENEHVTIPLNEDMSLSSRLRLAQSKAF